jgi:hypothetical protein
MSRHGIWVLKTQLLKQSLCGLQRQLMVVQAGWMEKS